MRKFVDKAWGVEEWLVNEPEYCAKYLRINPGYRCSLHYHKMKKETFIVTAGVVFLEQRDVRGVPIEEYLFAGESRTIQPWTPHRFRSANARESAIILEVSTHHDDADVVRIEESGKV